MATKDSIILTDNACERIEGNWDGERIALVQESKPADDLTGLKKVIILNPVEAVCLARFIIFATTKRDKEWKRR